MCWILGKSVLILSELQKSDSQILKTQPLYVFQNLKMVLKAEARSGKRAREISKRLECKTNNLSAS